MRGSTYITLLIISLIFAQHSVQASTYNIDNALSHYWNGDTTSYLKNNSANCGSIDISPFRRHKPENNIFRFAVSDFKDVLIAPVRWKKNDWKKAAVLVAGTGVIIMLDNNIYQQIQDVRTPFTENITKYVLEPFGNYSSYALLAGMFSYGLISGKSKPQETALLAVESYIITGIITYIPKTLFGRARPYSNNPPNHLDWKGPSTGNRSFWSGHTATAFSVASVIASMYDDNRTIQIVAYTTAALTGLSRIHDKKHWSSDVVVGAIVGTAIGQLIVRNHKSRSLKISPIVAPELQSLHISYTF